MRQNCEGWKTALHLLVCTVCNAKRNVTEQVHIGLEILAFIECNTLTDSRSLCVTASIRIIIMNGDNNGDGYDDNDDEDCGHCTGR